MFIKGCSGESRVEVDEYEKLRLKINKKIRDNKFAILFLRKHINTYKTNNNQNPCCKADEDRGLLEDNVVVGADVNNTEDAFDID